MWRFIKFSFHISWVLRAIYWADKRQTRGTNVKIVIAYNGMSEVNNTFRFRTTQLPPFKTQMSY